MSLAYKFHALFIGFLNESDDDDDMDLSEFDTQAYSLQADLDKLEPNRDPRLEVEYLGNHRDFEMKFVCNTTWMDRESDIDDYLDRVQEEIENNLEVMVTERQKLGYTQAEGQR